MRLLSKTPQLQSHHRKLLARCPQKDKIVTVPARRCVTRASALDPADARSAIAYGLELYNDKRDYEAAQEQFDRVLSGELPGSGVKRWRDKPAAISDGEKIAALYNIACCQAQLGNTQNGLIALAGALEAGYTNFQQIQSDPDLNPLRADPKFEGLIKKFDKGFMNLFKSF